MNNVEAHIFRRLLVGHTLNGELASLSGPFQPLGDAMNQMLPTERSIAWEGALALRADRAQIRLAVLSADPNAPMPVAPPARKYATGADMLRTRATARGVWPFWIPADSVYGIAGPEGSGKTRTMMDLCRRVRHQIAWPDGQPMLLSADSVFLWVCSDGHQNEIVDIAADMGVPVESIIFPAPPDEATANTSLDEDETWQWIEGAIVDCKPALTFIDTLTSATQLNLCEQTTIAKLKVPLVGLCQKHQISIGLSLHVSREGHALGRRIKGITRTLIQVECPDPENASERLRVWMEKSFDKKPEPLGCTIHSDRMEYDTNAPPKVIRNPGGRPISGRADAMAFIRDELTKLNDQVGNDLARQWKGGSRDTFWRAVEDMVKAAELSTTGGTGTRQQTVLHLITASQNPAQP
jgi:AAA domain